MKTGKSRDPLVAFFYLLMRDKLPSGVVEGIMEDIAGTENGFRFTNGLLAAHAEDIVARIEGMRRS